MRIFTKKCLVIFQRPLKERILSRVIFYSSVLALLWTFDALQKIERQQQSNSNHVPGLVASPAGADDLE